jgi:uncharacterized lipoprotein YddW (UPF0748 family)
MQHIKLLSHTSVSQDKKRTETSTEKQHLLSRPVRGTWVDTATVRRAGREVPLSAAFRSQLTDG